MDCRVEPGNDGERRKPLGRLVGRGIVARLRLGLIGAVLVAGPFPAVAAVAAIVAAAALTEIAALAEIATLAHLVAAGLGALVVAFVSAFVPARLAIAAVGPLALMAAMLRAHLRLRGHDDAIVVLGVLEIALGRNHVAGRERIAGERHVFLGDMRRRAPDLHVGAVRFVVPRQWILGLAAAASSPAILLSLPHVLSITCLAGLPRILPARVWRACPSLKALYAKDLGRAAPSL